MHPCIQTITDVNNLLKQRNKHLYCVYSSTHTYVYKCDNIDILDYDKLLITIYSHDWSFELRKPTTEAVSAFCFNELDLLSLAASNPLAFVWKIRNRIL